MDGFYANSAGAKTFDGADVNIATDCITITGHGFGANDAFVNLYYAQGTGDAVGGLTDKTCYQWRIVDSNTIECRDGSQLHDLTSAGTGTGHTFTPQFTYENVIIIGSGIDPDGSNQVRLGNSSILETYLQGDVYVPLDLIVTGNVTATDGTFTDDVIVGDTLTVSNAVTATSFSGDGQAVTIDASGFSGNLTTDDNTLQEVAAALDTLSAGGGLWTDDGDGSISYAGDVDVTGTVTATDASIGAVGIYNDRLLVAGYGSFQGAVTSLEEVVASGFTTTGTITALDVNVNGDLDVIGSISGSGEDLTGVILTSGGTIYGSLTVTNTVTVGAYTLPAVDGNSNQVLKTNGDGTLSWAADNSAAGSGISIEDSSAVVHTGPTVLDFTGALSATSNNADQVTVTISSIDGLAGGTLTGSALSLDNSGMGAATFTLQDSSDVPWQISNGGGVLNIYQSSSSSPAIRISNNDEIPSFPNGLTSDGPITGELKHDEVTVSTNWSGSILYGGVVFVNANDTTQTVAAVSAGMSISFISVGTNTVTIDCDNSDYIRMDGLSGAAGEGIVSDGESGAEVTLVGRSTTEWVVMGRSTVWTQESPP